MRGRAGDLPMKSANIAELRNHLSEWLALVEAGGEVEIHKRNLPIARIVPVPAPPARNRTVLGSGAGSVQVLGDLTEPALPEAEWDVLQGR